MIEPRISWRALFAAAVLAAPWAPAQACTDVLLKTDQHQVVSARNMDYPVTFHSKVIITPVGRAFQSRAEAGFPAAAWVARYGYVGITGGLATIDDGLNEKGLGVAEQNLGVARFPASSKDRPNLEVKLFCDWVLGNWSSVDEVEKALPSINPCGALHHSPVHFALHDRGGNSAVIEYIQGELKFHRNPNGVMTNGPSFDWQETNLNYFQWKRGMVNASVAIPGGYLSVERFIRASVMREALPAAGSTALAVANALAIMGSVAAPLGMPGTYVEEKAKEGKVNFDYTQWTVVRDHVNLVYYYKSIDSPGLKAVDLKAIDLSGRTSFEPVPVGNGDWSVPAPLVRAAGK